MKAYLIHGYSFNPNRGFSHDATILRILESVLIQLNGDAQIHKCSLAALDETTLLLKKNYSHESAYLYSRRLMALATFLSNKRMVACSLKAWKSSISAPTHHNIAIGDTGDKWRTSKEPDKRALEALGELFVNNPENSKDTFTTSFTALLICAPSRGNEVLALTANAEVESGDPLEYGWRFYSSKGYGPNIKWIPSVMVPLAKEAFSRMLMLSKDARALAQWLESGEDRFFRHPSCPDVLDTVQLSSLQAAQALGFIGNDANKARSYMKDRKFDSTNKAYTLNSLWMIVKTKTPPGFPWFDEKKSVKYSDCIFSILKHQLNDHAHTCPVILQKASLAMYVSDFSPPRGIFQRYGFEFEDGLILRVRSHQPRHLLNTIAQRGGLSNYDISKWSGRKHISSNRVYNHITDEEINKRVFELGLIEDLEPKTIPKINTPLHDADFAGRIQPASHVTEFGYCTHDFLISPCTKYRDCTNCEDQFYIKGQPDTYARLTSRLERLQQVLKLALEGQEKGSYGADRWVIHHQKSIARLIELLAMLDNNKIPEGAIIRLRGEDFTQLNRVLNNPKALENTQDGKTFKIK